MHKTLHTLALGLCLATSPALAFMSVESETIGPLEQGGSGQLSAALDGRAGNTDRENVTVGGKLNYQAGDTTVFLLTEHNRGKAYDQETEDNTWAHARYRDQIQHGLAAEAFVDFLQDDFRLLDARTQVGAGLRFTMDQEANYRGLYAGLGLLHEWEDQAELSDNYWRLNSYLAYQRQLNEQTRILFNLFYQPSLDHGSDFLASAELAILVKLASALDLKLGAKHEYDRKAPAGIEREDTRYVTALNFRF